MHGELNTSLQYERDKNYYDKRRNRKRLPWDGKEFIAWDGEGITPEVREVKPGETLLHMTLGQKDITEEQRQGFIDAAEKKGMPPKGIAQPYVLLANSKGGRITAEEGLDSIDCFELILKTKVLYPNSVFVGFGFSYDAAQILKDVSMYKLKVLYEKNWVRFRGYRIQYYPHKWLVISHPRSRRSAKIYDVFGFFQSSFIEACQKYLGKNDPDLQLIERGKAARQEFTWDELHDFIIPYNATELSMLVKVMTVLREDLHNIGLDLSLWHGPGAVATQLLQRNGIQFHMSRNIPEEVNEASRYAYAGGRFETFRLGYYPGTVYEYDIHSAYPYAASKLPGLSRGHWEYAESFQPGTFGVWNISYHAKQENHQPQPLFYRSWNRLISFPHSVDGWYWTPEASLVPDSVQYGYVWHPTESTRPFAFVEEMYADRQRYKEEGNPCERAIKLALNSIYGKLAQTIGAKDGPPKYHQLEWAGYITSYVRAMIYNAIITDVEAILSTETDAIFSIRPLPLDIGTGLGQWEETTFDSILYLQSGFYYATKGEEVIARSRGLDRDRTTGQPVGLPYRSVLDHLHNGRAIEYGRTPALLSTSTRFINIGLALQTDKTFRSWETQTKTISVDTRFGQSKRCHMKCYRCREGYRLSDCLHPAYIGSPGGRSHPHPLPWMPNPQEDFTLMAEAILKQEDWQ